MFYVYGAVKIKPTCYKDSTVIAATVQYGAAVNGLHAYVMYLLLLSDGTGVWNQITPSNVLLQKHLFITFHIGRPGIVLADGRDAEPQIS